MTAGPPHDPHHPHDPPQDGSSGSPPSAESSPASDPWSGPPADYPPGSATVPTDPMPSNQAPTRWQPTPPQQWQPTPPQQWQPDAGTSAQQPWPGPYQPVPQPDVPAPRRRTAVKILSSIGSVVLVICIAVAVKSAPAFLEGLGGGNQTFPSASHPSGEFATSTATASPTGPFEGTPAATFPVGEAGITLPVARAVSGFSKSQVAAALAKVKKGLVAARLDQRMLVGRDSSALLSLLAPDARSGVKTDFDKDNFFSFATQIAPGAKLADRPPRVRGRVTFRAAKVDGVRLLEVITNFVWVYPFAGVATGPGDRLVVVHDEVHWSFPVGSDVESTSRGMWLGEAKGYASGMDCDQINKSLLALGKPSAVPGGASGGDDATMFDPDRSLEIKDTC